MGADSVLFGDGRQGNKTNVAGNQTGLQGCHQHALAPRGVLSDVAGGTLRGPPA
jgi:hypothetical protein